MKAGISNRIRAAMRGRTLRSVATSAGVSLSTLEKLLSGRDGKSGPTLDTVERLAEALDVDPAFLAGWEE